MRETRLTARGGRDGRERLGDLLSSVVEDRPHRAAGTVDWRSRAFVTAVEGRRDRGRASAERPRAGAILAATALCAAAGLGLAMWPIMAASVRHAQAARMAASRPQQAQAAAPSQPHGAVAQTTTVPGGGASVATGAGQRPASGSPVAAAPAGAGQGVPASTPAWTPTPAATQTTTGTTATTTNPQAATAGSTPAVAAAAPALPPVTWANQQVVGPSLSGSWNSLSQGGYPNFQGPIHWVNGPSSSGATWTLGSTSGGQRWDQVRVQVYVPDKMAGAVVRYTVTATNGGSTVSHSFDVAQQPVSGWQWLQDQSVSTFSIGTATQRTGSITVRMTYVSKYTGPAEDPTCINVGGCTAMAVSDVAFQWS